MLRLPQTPMNFPVNFLDRSFVHWILWKVGQRIACPPIEKGGGCSDTAATKPVHSSFKKNRPGIIDFRDGKYRLLAVLTDLLQTASHNTLYYFRSFLQYNC